MSDNVLGFPITIPAGTSPNNPQVTPTPLGIADVVSLLIVVPPGPAGNVGFAINAGGTQVYPLKPGVWFVFDDYKYSQDVANQINSGQWSVSAYNTDVFAHTLTVYFYTNNIAYSPDSGFSLPIGI